MEQPETDDFMILPDPGAAAERTGRELLILLIHKINNYLTVVDATADGALRRGDAESAQAALRTISAQSEALSQLVKDMRRNI